MGVVRSVTEPEWSVDYSTFAVRGHHAGSEWDERFDESSAPSVTGRLAVAGHGWLRVTSRADHVHVTLELHDGPPPPEPTAEGARVVETPFVATSSQVMLDALVPSSGGCTLQLAGPGPHRVRVSRQSVDDDGLEHWLLAFWAVAEPIEPPQWYAVASPPPDDGAMTQLAWRTALPHEAIELVDVLRAFGPMDTGELADWWRRRGWPGDVLDQPLVEEPVPLSCGFPERDEEEQEQRADYARQRREEWQSLATALSLPAPATRRDALPLLVACDLLARVDEERYSAVDVPPHPRDVLDLSTSAQWRQDAREVLVLHGDLAGDLERIVLWSPGQTCATTLRALSERTLEPVPRVRGALSYAASQRWLAVDGDPRDPDAALTLALGDRQPPPLPPAVVEEAFRTARPRRAPVRGPAEPLLPAQPGPAPRWGAVVDGTLWRPVGDEQVAVDLGDRRVSSARRTAHGTLLTGSDGTALVDDDGGLHDLGPFVATIDPTGRHAAGVERHYGRTAITYRLHLVDLATLESSTMPWPKARSISRVTVDADGSVTFEGEPDADDSERLHALYRWHPVAEPVREPEPLTTVTSSLRTRRAVDGLHLTWPSGTVQHLAVSDRVQVAPSGGRLWSLRHDPPAVAVWDLDERRTASPRHLPVPRGTRVMHGEGSEPVWESGDHLLLRVEPFPLRDLAGIRLDVRTGAVQRIVLPGSRSDSVVFVEMPPPAGTTSRRRLRPWSS